MVRYLRCFLHAILCLVCVPSGLSIHASLQPVDPVLQVGSSLTLSCTLHHSHYNKNRTSNSIIWTKGSTPIPTSRYATPNISTSLLHLHNVTTEDAGKYYCQFADDEWSEVSGVHVFIGTPPDPVENVTCEASNMNTFSCEWDSNHPTSNLAVMDTLQFKQDFQDSWQTCRLTTRTRCEAVCDMECGDTLQLQVSSANALGTVTMQPEPIIFNEIVRPHPVRDLIVTAVEPECLTVAWAIPHGWEESSYFLEFSIVYRVLDHSTNSEWIEVNSYFGYETFHQFCQLKSYSTYEVKVSIKFMFYSDDSMVSWSEPVKATTKMTAPSGAPRNLTLSSSSENPDWISVTWLPLDPLEENGIITGYFIYSCPMNSSYPHSLAEETVRNSGDPGVWTSLLCDNGTAVDNFTMTTDERRGDIIEYTLIDCEPGESYVVWVSAVNSGGEGPATEPLIIALPNIQERRGRTGVMIVSAITICQVIFIIGIGLCCWQAGIDPFKRKRRVPQPYIPPEVLAMKHQSFKPRPPCTEEFFNELCEYKEDKSLLEPPRSAEQNVVSNSGGSNVDHGFYDMQSGSSISGSGSSSYHTASTLRCSVNLAGNKQVVLMKDPETGYCVATSVKDKRTGSSSENENPSKSICVNSNYDIEEVDEDVDDDENDEDSDGYVNPNSVDPSTVGVSKIILKGSVYHKPTARHRFQSNQSDGAPSVLTSVSDQGFGSADSDPDSREVSPTESTSHAFPDFIPTKLDMLIANADMKEQDYFGLDEIESICSSMASSRYRSTNGDDFPYRLPSVTSYRRKSKSSNKSSGSESESEVFTGYMSMATKEDCDTDYGYVAKDHYMFGNDDTAFLASQEQDKPISTYDMSGMCLEAQLPERSITKHKPFCISPSRDIPRGQNRQSPISSSSSLTSSETASSSPCSSVSSTLSTVSELPTVLVNCQADLTVDESCD